MTTTDRQQLAALLAALHPDDLAAVAYQHAKDGCPFEDTSDIPRCPAGCDDGDMIAMHTETFFGGIATA